jgi:UPF0176 protein
MSVVVAAFYHFTQLEDYEDMREPLLKKCAELGIKGSILLAKEGINSTIAGSREGIDSILAHLRSDARLSAMEHKESFATDLPFYRMKVLLKKEIVTLGVDGIDPTKDVGTYVDPKDWNNLISNPDVVVLDTRNVYEYAIGTFDKAVDPNTETFREFPAFVEENLEHDKDKPIAMFCTGGIRCEKASAYMLARGFKTVYHLKGGILKYLEDVPKEQSLWHGDCFVFDHRTAVTHGLEYGDHETCFGCRWPISTGDKSSSHYKEGVHCPHCYDSRDEAQKAAAEARHHQVRLAEKLGHKHLGR